MAEILSELRSCVKAEVAVLVYPSLVFLMVSVDINITERERRAQELCESRGGRPAPPLPVPDIPYGLCGRKATLNWN